MNIFIFILTLVNLLFNFLIKQQQYTYVHICVKSFVATANIEIKIGNKHCK